MQHRRRNNRRSLTARGTPETETDPAHVAEQAHRELILAADEKLQDASRALAQAQSNICIQEDRLLASEFRAQKAEAEVREVVVGVFLRHVAEARDLIGQVVHGGGPWGSLRPYCTRDAEGGRVATDKHR